MFFAPLNKLVDAGFEALAQGNYRKALAMAKRIQKKKNSAAYEIAGRAYWEMGERDKAIETLQKGAEIAPQVFVFWSYLGHYYSDMGEYDKAVECLTRGVFLKAPTGEFEYNMAVVRGRQGDPEAALMHLDQFNWQASNLPLVGLHEAKAYWLGELERFDEAVAECDLAMALIDDDTAKEIRARLHSTKAKALWNLKADPSLVREEAYHAVRLDKTDSSARWLLRETDIQKSPTARKCTAVVRGNWPEPIDGQPMSFLAHYTLVAENEEHVLSLIRPFEPAEMRDGLVLQEVLWRDYAPDLPVGVYDAGKDYIFHPPERPIKVRLRLKQD